MKTLARQSGFTLIELMIAIAIIGIIATATTANLNQNNRRNNVNYAAKKIASDIHKTQAYALGLKKFNGVIPANGWGIFFSKANDAYIIYADVNSNNKYDYVGADIFNSTEKFEAYQLSGLDLYSIVTDGGERNFASILYKPPELKVNICRNNVNTLCNRADTTIGIQNTSFNETVFVNKYGLVE